ncbi:hypothetical protein MAR_010191 [Mya arenaria]|uniref:Uncharacterized protein n=1 Tax=Mya arenaria TaxID=6604 RepID=A0ABY7E0X3_MYAAR|nr:uncharacterized protein LOC128232603 [Mya arenaria]WAR03633.1 hypothetical protein MAR_010191 [Mya arenaria]
MGNCCGTEEEQKPLLVSGRVGVRSGTLSQPPAGPVLAQPAPIIARSPGPTSARLHNPIKQKDFEKSIQLIATVQLLSLPLTSLDKTFQDLGRLYNEVVGNFRSLEEEIRKFKEYFLEETSGIPVLEECVAHLVNRVGTAKITVERRSKTFIEITYDKEDISKNCKGEADQSLRPLEHFSRACRHIREVLEHAPQVERNVKIILADEDRQGKDIMKSELSADAMQRATHDFHENVSKLRVVAAGTDTIRRDVEKKFKEFANASKGFFKEES